MILIAMLVLVASSIGIGIGYAVFHTTAPTTPATAPTTAPTTAPPATSPEVGGVAAKVDPGLVDVDTTLPYLTISEAGTGIVVTPSGEVLTNNHVIQGGASLHVTDVGNGKRYTAEVVGYDVTADIAVLQIIGASHLHTVSFAKSQARLGQTVVAIGNAGGNGGTPSAVSGAVTGLNQAITAEDALSGATEHLTGLIKTSAPIEAGDSGGPLVDAHGHVVGMNTAGSSHFAFAQGAAEGYSIPAGTVRTIAHQIERAEPSSTVHVGPTAFLGVLVSEVDTSGAFVLEVLSDTAAATIGLVPGDTIVSLGNHAIRAPNTLSDILQTEEPGTTVPIGWLDQAGQPHTGTVTLKSGPPA